MTGTTPRPAGASPADLLVARVLAGETQAFDGLMQLTDRLVLGVAWKLLRDRELARDAAQEAFLRAYRSLPTFRQGDPFEPWICRITVNVCRDLQRRRGPLPLPVEGLDQLPQGADSDHPAEVSLLRDQRRSLVRRALAALPEKERTALVLRDLEGFPTEDVARVLGVRPVTIRTQVASARAKLRAVCERLLGGSR